MRRKVPCSKIRGQIRKVYQIGRDSYSLKKSSTDNGLKIYLHLCTSKYVILVKNTTSEKYH